MVGGYLLLIIVYYHFLVYGGVHWFRGPISNVQDAGMVKSGSEESGSVKEKGGSSTDVKEI